jgi:Dolichyl-phosphate-mannose-protein mannosyltransferase
VVLLRTLASDVLSSAALGFGAALAVHGSAAPQAPLEHYVARMTNNYKVYWGISIVLILLLGLALRLHGIHNPMLDHPGWRQGDTAAIARNFARLQFNIMYPQTMYNGPPPNYVELELQIVPFIAAGLYKAFGIHEIFGRIVSVLFSLLTIVTIGYFARWLFGSALAGLSAAFIFAVFPGSVYYGRTFMPDAAMVFFLTAAIYAAARYLLDEPRLRVAATIWPAALLTLAYLAKPVAVVALAPLAGVMVQRLRERRAMQPISIALLLVLPPLLLLLYDRRVGSYAEWHWASGITQLHVLPALRASFGSFAGFGAKLGEFGGAIAMLRQTMLGPLGFWIALASFIALPWVAARSKTLVWWWLAGALLYTYVVVTVERVDYYLAPFLPLCALAMGGALHAFVAAIRRADAAPIVRYALLGMVPLVAIVLLATSRAPVQAYYRYSKQVYRDAVQVDRALPKDALVVIGHYGPNVQYYIDRFGWEEDPALWTPFDEESAIRKGARYFISIEDRRLRENRDLCVWLQRFPLVATRAGWPIYHTDPGLVAPNAEAQWRAFRNTERAGNAAAFLQAHGLCQLTLR